MEVKITNKTGNVILTQELPFGTMSCDISSRKIAKYINKHNNLCEGIVFRCCIKMKDGQHVSGFSFSPWIAPELANRMSSPDEVIVSKETQMWDSNGIIFNG